ncbi:MAG: DUF892 family protein [Gammaproteobacteria bacterium]|mgnify:CR=1 FL=1
MQLPRPSSSPHQGNLGTMERWLSAAVGIGLLLTATRGDPLGRLARGGTAVALLARAGTGHCAVKAAMQGDSSFRDGLREQLQRLTRLPGSAGSHIDSMETLYAMELQELHSAESQLAALVNKLVPIVNDGTLAFRLQEYASELHSRRLDLEKLLARKELRGRAHADDAMHALVTETNKMVELCESTVRDAAIVASLQRIIHYKIAGYGTIATYAKALGRREEAEHFAHLADRDKVIDGEMTRLAKVTLNPQALQVHEPRPAVVH